jgi:hypothetical protein
MARLLKRYVPQSEKSGCTAATAATVATLWGEVTKTVAGVATVASHHVQNQRQTVKTVATVADIARVDAGFRRQESHAFPEGQRPKLSQLSQRITFCSALSENQDGGPYSEGLAHLEACCPDNVDNERWQKACDDARRFLASRGTDAAALGWLACDLFDYSPRWDLRGLVWFLHGNAVSELDATSAAFITPSGSRLVYRRANRGGR